MAMILSCPAFSNGAPIQPIHTCEGENRSPELEWSNYPEGTQSLIISLEDPDAPGGIFYHWLVYALDPTRKNLPGGLPKTPLIPGNGRQAKNSFGRIGYDGPCPPPGKAHRYILYLFAMDELPSINSGMNAREIMTLMQGHVLERAETFGIYKRS